MPQVGEKAPDFTLYDQNGQKISLSDYRGKKVALYFYAKDNTPGCTQQSCGFGELAAQFEAENTVILGVSKDSIPSHPRFAQKYSLPFSILSDPELEAIKAYDVWQEKKLYGKVSMGVVRTSFLIDEEGVIIQVWNKAKAALNPQQMLDYLSADN